MKVKVYKTEQYEDCNIYYRNLRDHFEYLTVIGGAIFTAHIRVKPHWITRILYWLGFEEVPYSQQQQEAIIETLRRMAITTIIHIHKELEEEMKTKQVGER